MQVKPAPERDQVLRAVKAPGRQPRAFNAVLTNLMDAARLQVEAAAPAPAQAPQAAKEPADAETTTDAPEPDADDRELAEQPAAETAPAAAPVLETTAAPVAPENVEAATAATDDIAEVAAPEDLAAPPADTAPATVLPTVQPQATATTIAAPAPALNTPSMTESAPVEVEAPAAPEVAEVVAAPDVAATETTEQAAPGSYFQAPVAAEQAPDAALEPLAETTPEATPATGQPAADAAGDVPAPAELPDEQPLPETERAAEGPVGVTQPEAAESQPEVTQAAPEPAAEADNVAAAPPAGKTPEISAPAESAPADDSADWRTDTTAPVAAEPVPQAAKATPVPERAAQPAPQAAKPALLAPQQPQPVATQTAAASAQAAQPRTEPARNTAPAAESDVVAPVTDALPAQPSVPVVAQPVLAPVAAAQIVARPNAEVAAVQRPVSGPRPVGGAEARQGDADQAVVQAREAARKANAARDADPSARGVARRNFEVVRQMARTIAMRHAGQETEVRLALTPPNLGAIRLRLKIEDGSVSGSIVTDSQATRHLLQSQLSEMREALRQEGLTLGSFDISSDARESQGRQDQAGRRNQNLAGSALEAQAAAAPARQFETATVNDGRVQGYL